VLSISGARLAYSTVDLTREGPYTNTPLRILKVPLKISLRKYETHGSASVYFRKHQTLRNKTSVSPLPWTFVKKPFLKIREQHKLTQRGMEAFLDPCSYELLNCFIEHTLTCFTECKAATWLPSEVGIYLSI
jgi:hypothetical protein